jgi:hypothetical protein
MGNHTLRLYVVAATLAAFFLLWAVIAAKPWASSTATKKPEVDPRVVSLERFQRHLRRETAVVRRTENRVWNEYRRRLRLRETQIAAAKERYQQQVAAAQAAEARIAQVRAAYAAAAAARSASASSSSSATSAAPSSGGVKTVTTYTVSRVQSAPIVTHAAAAPAPPPVTKVVTLPPQVQVVTLPPASSPSTHSSSSHH